MTPEERRKHADYMRAYHRHPENRKKNIERCARYRSTHRKELGAASLAYYRKNKAACLERMKKWAAENRERSREIKQNWTKRNPEKVRAKRRREATNGQKALNQLRHRARKRNAEGSFTRAAWNTLCKQHDYRCAHCHRRRKLEPDHIVPVSKGGSNWIRNIQPLCRSCNAKKWTH